MSGHPEPVMRHDEDGSKHIIESDQHRYPRRDLELWFDPPITLGAWRNAEGKPVLDEAGNPTDEIHEYITSDGQPLVTAPEMLLVEGAQFEPFPVQLGSIIVNGTAGLNIISYEFRPGEHVRIRGERGSGVVISPYKTPWRVIESDRGNVFQPLRCLYLVAFNDEVVVVHGEMLSLIAGSR